MSVFQWCTRCCTLLEMSEKAKVLLNEVLEKIIPRDNPELWRLRRFPTLLLVGAIIMTSCGAADGLSLSQRETLPHYLKKSCHPPSTQPYRDSQSWHTRIRYIRGGAFLSHRAQSASSSVTTSPSSDPDKNTRQERGMAVALFSTYFCVMGAKCALPSVLSLLLNPDTGLDFSSWSLPPQQLFSRQLAIATMAVAFGKLVLGPVIDVFGGIASLQVALMALSLLLASIASCHTFLTFAVCWIFVDFIFSSCWAACISAIHQCFPEHEWAGRVGMLAAAARTGNAVAFAVFASVLHYTASIKSPWRVVFWVSATMQFIPIMLVTYFGRFYKDTMRQEAARRPLSVSTSLACLKREAATLEFWLHLLSRSALMVFGSFLLFIPTLMTNCYGATSAFGAQVGSIFALGCLISVTFGSQLYATLSKKSKIVAIVSLLGTATLSSLTQLAHMKGMITLSAAASAFLLFLSGFSFAVPFYIPPSLYALSRGGKTSSATIADMFDFAGFGLLAVFNGYVASIPHNVLSAWIPTFRILSACSLVSLVALSLATYHEE